jgi:hypothetical protein
LVALGYAFGEPFLDITGEPTDGAVGKAHAARESSGGLELVQTAATQSDLGDDFCAPQDSVLAHVDDSVLMTKPSCAANNR